ncbi:MAG: LCP family protein [Oscillospiraceae bacterium]
MSDNQNNTHSQKHTPEQKRRAAKRKAKRRMAKLLSVLLTICAIGVLAYVFVDHSISGMFNQGQSINKDIRTPEALKGDVINILVCGIDQEEGRSGYMTDVVMYVTLDAKAKKVSVLQIPRDTYVGEEIPTGKINAVFNHGKEKEKILNTIELINDKLALPVDHYAYLDMEAFITVVDSIEGGLEMYVPCPIIAKDKNTGVEEVIIEKPGNYKISGETAEAIVRNRNYAMADIERLNVQRHFYSALIKYFTNIGISDFLKLLPRFTPYISTDMSWQKMGAIANVGLQIDFANMSMMKPVVAGAANGTVTVNKEELANMLNEYFRPYQDPVPASKLKIPQLENTTDWVPSNIQTVADIMASET